jgi:uncharacterized protein YndB with AHSA1/START domain
MSEGKTVLTRPSDRELVFTRTFNAPPELVFEAWTDPRHVVHWWGPRGFNTTSLDMDFRPGGKWRLIMHGPDGTDYNNVCNYLEIDKPHRIVYNHGDPPFFQSTITFEPVGSKQTKLTMHQRFSSASFLQEVVQKYHADEGGAQTLDRLGEHVELMLPQNRIERKLLITRTFNAPRPLVFSAWTDPKHLANWWSPKDFTNRVCEVDVRPGGAMHIVMRAPDGTEYPMRGFFREIVPPERLVFLAIAKDAIDRTLLESLTTVNFAEEGGKTKITLKAEAIGFAPVARQMLDGMETGWTQSLDRLEELTDNF